MNNHPNNLKTAKLAREQVANSKVWQDYKAKIAAERIAILDNQIEITKQLIEYAQTIELNISKIMGKVQS